MGEDEKGKSGWEALGTAAADLVGPQSQLFNQKAQKRTGSSPPKDSLPPLSMPKVTNFISFAINQNTRAGGKNVEGVLNFAEILLHQKYHFLLNLLGVP